MLLETKKQNKCGTRSKIIFPYHRIKCPLLSVFYTDTHTIPSIGRGMGNTFPYTDTHTIPSIGRGMGNAFPYTDTHTIPSIGRGMGNTFPYSLLKDLAKSLVSSKCCI